MSEERKERFQKIQQLATRIGGMNESERQALAARLPTVLNPDGHPLTFRNTALLTMQSGREDITIVAGFKQWIKAGRVVTKGEHALGYILVPMSSKKKDDDDDENNRMHFKHVAVFDVSQTGAMGEKRR